MAWVLDPHHTAVSFSAKHLGVSTVRGRFTKVDGEIDLDDPNDPTTARGTVVVETASVDTGNEGRDQHLRGADFFEVEKYPTITFKSTKVEGRGDSYKLTGDLTIKDVTRPVTLDVTSEGQGTSPWGTTVAAYSASTTINRKDFGLNWNVALETGGVLVGKKVRIELNVQAVASAHV